MYDGGIGLDIIKVDRIADFCGSTRYYYNLWDTRIIDVRHHDNIETWHKHNQVTEILFILEGKVRVNTEIESKDLKENQVVVFPPNEKHYVEPLTPKTRILVFKYIKSKNNNIGLISNDWEGI